MARRALLEETVNTTDGELQDFYALLSSQFLSVIFKSKCNRKNTLQPSYLQTGAR